MAQVDVAAALPHDAVAKLLKTRVASRAETTGRPAVIG
jgi:hypothetical protein